MKACFVRKEKNLILKDYLKTDRICFMKKLFKSVDSPVIVRSSSARNASE